MESLDPSLRSLASASIARRKDTLKGTTHGGSIGRNIMLMEGKPTLLKSLMVLTYHR